MKALIPLLLLLCLSAPAVTIKQTIAEIKALQQKIAEQKKQNEVVLKKLASSNPLFASKSPFESDEEYNARRAKAEDERMRMRDAHVAPLEAKLKVLFDRRFLSDKVTVILDSAKYDANVGQWRVAFRYGRKKFDTIIAIPPAQARKVADNKEKLLVRGALAVSQQGKAILAGLGFHNPAAGFSSPTIISPIITLEHWNTIWPAVAFSPNGHILAMGSEDNRARVYSLLSGKDVREFVHGGTVLFLTFSPDGRFLATGSFDNKARVFSLSSGKLVCELVHKSPVGAVAFSSDGRFLATGSEDKTARVFALPLGNQEYEFVHGHTVGAVAFSPDGCCLATGSYDNKARVFSLASGNLEKTFVHGGNVASVAFSFDGRYLATGSWDNKARVFSLPSGRMEQEFTHVGCVWSVSFSSDGRYLATNSSDNKAHIFSLPSGKLEQECSHGGDVLSLAFSADERNLSTSINNHRPPLFTLPTGQLEREFVHRGKSLFLAFSTDGRFLLVGRPDNKARVFRIFEPIDFTSPPASQQPDLPPALAVKLTFTDHSGNKILDALEAGKLLLTVSNTGKGAAKGLSVAFVPASIAGITFGSGYLAEIAPGETKTIEVPIEAGLEVATATHHLKISIEETHGFAPAPMELTFSTKAYEKPDLIIADVGIDDSNGNGQIEPGEIIKLLVRIANNGKGTAKAATATFSADKDVFFTPNAVLSAELGDLAPGASVDLPLEMFVNNRTPDAIPLYIDLRETTGLANKEKLRLPLLKSAGSRSISKLVIEGSDTDFSPVAGGLSIDIETAIPTAKALRKDALAVVFGIEKYRNVSDVSFARRDAAFAKEYFARALGIPDERIYYKANADLTKGVFDKVFAPGGWLAKRASKGKSEIFVYYAGHAAPELGSKRAYLIPADGDPNYPQQTGYALDSLYDNLARLDVGPVTVFLDTCFSGANRENQMLLAGARPVRLEVLDPAMAAGITVFSAASGTQVSSAWPEQKHGLFTYFLLKGLQGAADSNKDKQLTVGELSGYIAASVPSQAALLDREQQPQVKTTAPERVLARY